MSELDELKETIGRLKLWLGILVVTDISLFSWAVANYGNVKNLLIILTVNAIMVLTFLIFFLDRKIRVTIERLREL